MDEFTNPYLDEVIEHGLPIDGRPANPSKKRLISSLIDRYGYVIVTPTSLRPFAEAMQRLNIHRAICVGSQTAYAESRLVEWFGKEVHCVDTRPPRGTPAATWGQTVHQGDHTIVSEYAQDALFMSFPLGFAAECVRKYHQAGGRLVCYIGTLARPNAGKGFFDYLQEHSECEASTRVQRKKPKKKGSRKSKIPPRGVSRFNAIAQTFIPTVISTSRDDGPAPPPAPMPGVVMKRVQKRGMSTVAGAKLSRKTNRDVVQVHVLKPYSGQ